MNLAAKLPYNHPYAGGYPGIGSQPLPSDDDALTYLAAVAVADGAGVEVGVANAVDAFVRGCKADGIWSAIKASCILAGARTLAGALVPLVGDAPTNVADGFVSGDYTRGGATPGLKGDGTSYLDSGRANDADGQDDMHLAVYETATHDDGSNFGTSIGTRDFEGPPSSQIAYRASTASLVVRAKDSNGDTKSRATSVTGFTGISRSTSASFAYRYGGADGSIAAASVPIASANYPVFAQEEVGVGMELFSNARIAFYSIGESLDLAALDAHVSNLVTNIGAAL